jgi:hypothetical protein
MSKPNFEQLYYSGGKYISIRKFGIPIVFGAVIRSIDLEFIP